MSTQLAVSQCHRVTISDHQAPSQCTCGNHGTRTVTCVSRGLAAHEGQQLPGRGSRHLAPSEPSQTVLLTGSGSRSLPEISADWVQSLSEVRAERKNALDVF